MPENGKSSLSSAEVPAGYPNKNSNNGKIESVRGKTGKGKRWEPLPYIQDGAGFPRKTGTRTH